MPICTVDRKRPGSAARSSAVWAPHRPDLAIVLRRGLRDETIAISAIANTPFRAISMRMTTTSNQGNGGRGEIGGMARAHLSREGRPVTRLSVTVRPDRKDLETPLP